MTLQAAVNGDRPKADHPAVPVTQDELIRDGVSTGRQPRPEQRRPRRRPRSGRRLGD